MTDNDQAREVAAWIVHSSYGDYVTLDAPYDGEEGLPRTPLYKGAPLQHEAILEGYVLVPKIMTADMIEEFHCCDGDGAQNKWDAVLAAVVPKAGS